MMDATARKTASQFGALVRNRRLSMSISQLEMARLIDTSPAYLSRIERGLEPPPSDAIIARMLVQLAPLPGGSQAFTDKDVIFTAAGRLPPDLRGKLADIVRLARMQEGE